VPEWPRRWVPANGQPPSHPGTCSDERAEPWPSGERRRVQGLAAGASWLAPARQRAAGTIHAPSRFCPLVLRRRPLGSGLWLRPGRTARSPARLPGVRRLAGRRWRHGGLPDPVLQTTASPTAVRRLERMPPHGAPELKR